MARDPCKFLSSFDAKHSVGAWRRRRARGRQGCFARVGQDSVAASASSLQGASSSIAAHTRCGNAASMRCGVWAIDSILEEDFEEVSMHSV